MVKGVGKNLNLKSSISTINHGFHTKNHGFHAKNDRFYAQHDGFCVWFSVGSDGKVHTPKNLYRNRIAQFAPDFGSNFPLHIARSRYISSASDDKSVAIWRVADWRQEHTVDQPYLLRGICAHNLDHRITWKMGE